MMPGPLDGGKGWPSQLGAMDGQSRQSTYLPSGDYPSAGNLIMIYVSWHTGTPPFRSLYPCLNVFGRSMLSFDHVAIDPVTSLDAPHGHCNATHPCFTRGSVWPSNIVRPWLLSTFTNSLSYISCLATMGPFSPSPRILPLCLLPDRLLVLRRPSTGLRNWSRRRRSTNAMPLTRSPFQLQCPLGRPSCGRWKSTLTKPQSTIATSTNVTSPKISNATGSLST